MAESVGQIGLDLVVNKNGFEKQMSGIQGLAKKAGAALAAAFAVKKIIDFGAQCIELGSDLNEVQNVVDVTFPHMSKMVNEFAQNAAASFGLSETMAKKFTGTFGAMAKAFGFSESAAYDMSTTLTGLSGDVASFYNISQDEAYTKLKSVFTGETETLKDLGIVMTQSALDAYALANGYGNVTSKMSEAEKVGLRYKFVQDQLSLATGDFIRTSDGWANQVRILKLQFDSLKATIGQGLINVLTPVIKVINQIISKIMSLANAFKSFTEMITGKKSGGGSAAATAGMDATAGAADDASAAVSGAGAAAKKAAKDMRSTGIDELNIIDPDTGSGGGGSGGESGGYTPDEFDMGELSEPAEEAENKFQGLIDKAKELKDLFMEGFWEGLGDTAVFDSIKQSLQSIGESLLDIFTDPAVVAAADNCLNSIVLNAGRIVGSFVSIGVTIADNLLGGISMYLEQNNQRIKDYLVSMFDITARVAEIAGQFSMAFAYVFSAFRSDSAKQITADVIGIFSDAFMGTAELCMKFGADVLDMITAPFIENKELFKQTLEDTFSTIEPIFGEIKAIVDEVFDKLNETYDSSIAPMMESFKTGLTEIQTKLLEAYNQYILPVLQGLSDRFGEFHEQYLSPLIDKFMEFASKVAEAVTAVWENALKPFILWLIEVMGPGINETLSAIIDMFFGLFEGISETLGYIFDALGGLMDYFTGIYTGNWQAALDGMNTYNASIWEAIKSFFSAALEFLCRIMGINLTEMKNNWNTIWTAISTTAKSIWDGIQTAIMDKITIISTAINGWIDGIKQEFAGLVEFIAGVFTGDWSRAWEGVKDIFKGVFNGIVSLLEGAMNLIVDGINGVLGKVNTIASTIGDKIGFNLNIPTLGRISIPRLAQGGFVRANTPQLAMIGDNRHYGEIVAPEDKMQEMVDRAVAMASAGSGMSDQYLMVMIDLLKKIIELIEGLELVVNLDIREIRQKLVDLEKRTGFKIRTT